MGRTYTITMEFEVKMTSPGYPATGPSYSSGGEPAEPPEFDIETCSFEGGGKSIEVLFKEHKAKYPQSTQDFEDFFAEQVFDKVQDLAHKDDWTEDDDLEYKI